MLINATHDNIPEERGSRLGFIIVLLLFITIISFAYYYFQIGTDKSYHPTALHNQFDE